jgi:hypothetical protein
MSRPNLRRARAMVIEHCRAYGVPYVENNLFKAHAIVVRHLNEVGWKGRHAFVCPPSAEMGRR